MNDLPVFPEMPGAARDAAAAASPSAGSAPTQEAFAAAREGAVRIPLAGWTAIAIDGPDATAFLHGQFTNDVAGLAVGAVQWNAWCSPKGRVLATFALARTGESGYLLALPADVAPAFEKRLRMFVMRSKVTVASLAQSHACVGIAGPLAAQAVPDVAAGALARREGLSVLGLPEPAPGRLLAVCERAAVEGWWSALAGSTTAAGEPVWDWLGIAAGIACVTVPVQDRFVPQMLNWEVVGGVNFQKGCYPGQEIVARMQYLGKLKERMVRASAPVPVAVGAPIYGAAFGDQACGTVVNTAPAPDGAWDVLAVVQIASAEQDRLRLGLAPDAPGLTLSPLPYSLPAARER